MQMITLSRKSQIAIEYSYRVKERSPQTSIFWVHASSRAKFEQSYGEIFSAVGMKDTGGSRSDQLRSVSGWLADEGNGPWFLILDNVDDATVLLDVPANRERPDEPTGRALIEYVPQIRHGAMLITSRDHTSATKLTNHCGRPILVTGMVTNESVRLLQTRLPETNEEEALQLVAELENIPLAITPAGAYIQELSPVLSATDYLEMIRRNSNDREALLNEDSGDLRRYIEGSNSVIATWEITFDHIRTNFKSAARLLSLMAYLNRQALTQSLIKGRMNTLEYRKAITPLLSFSLIRVEIGGSVFGMHRLVQVALRCWLCCEGSDQIWMQQAIARVEAHFPRGNSGKLDTGLAEALMAHVDEFSLYETDSTKSELTRA